MSANSQQTELWVWAAEPPLSPAEFWAYKHVRMGPYGVRQFARMNGRSPGTIGNLLHRADEKLGRK